MSTDDTKVITRACPYCNEPVTTSKFSPITRHDCELFIFFFVNIAVLNKLGKVVNV